MAITRQNAAQGSRHLRSRAVPLQHPAETTAQKPHQRQRRGGRSSLPAYPPRLKHGVKKLQAPRARGFDIDSQGPLAACGEVPGLELRGE